MIKRARWTKVCLLALIGSITVACTTSGESSSDELLIHAADFGAVFISDLDGMVIETLTDAGLQASFSPDGTKVAYVEVVNPSSPAPLGETRIAVFDRIEGTTTQTDSYKAVTRPSWSSDGKHLAVASISEDPFALGVSIAAVETLELTEVVPPGSETAPFGSLLIGESWDRGDNRLIVHHLSATSFFSVAADGSDPRLLDRSPDNPIQELSMSPDGRWTATSHNIGATWIEIADDNTSRELVTGLLFASSLTWSPDSRMIAFLDSESLKIVDLEGALVADVPIEQQGKIVWSPDSSRVAFSELGDGTERTELTSQNQVLFVSLDGTTNKLDLGGVVTDWRRAE